MHIKEESVIQIVTSHFAKMCLIPTVKGQIMLMPKLGDIELTKYDQAHQCDKVERKVREMLW
jgi:hypothetical protein